jgi:YfiH family protein
MRAAEMTPAVLRPQWAAPPGVQAAFTLRGGGVSQGRYDSFNLGSHVGDGAAAVAENRRRLRAALALPAEPNWLSQVHGTDVLDLDLAPSANAATAGDAAVIATADAAVTRRRGVVAAVLVADCLPVLLATHTGSAVAVAHAGWRGLAAGVIEAAVAAFAAPRGGVCAWLGPAIGAAHFEVGEEVRGAFLAHEAAAAAGFVRNPRGRWQCDLVLLARQRLAAAGVSVVAHSGLCTFADARLYSYRRDGVTGRMAALIWRE